MKKSLETELMQLAEEIIQKKNRADVHELKAMAGILYEKLSVLSFTEKHFGGMATVTAKKEIEDALAIQSDKKQENKKQKGDNEDRYAPDGLQYNPEGITEPNTEKIKDIVAQMPPDSEEVDEVLDGLLPKENHQDDFSKAGVHFDDLPQFEPLEAKRPPEQNKSASPENRETPIKEVREKQEEATNDLKKKEEGSPIFPQEKQGKALYESINNARANGSVKKTSLNDRLKKGVSFGLNDRLLYIKHLFDGNGADYDRVISQLNTFDSYEEAKIFIDNMVKPDYGFWEEQQSYEKRFLEAIKSKL